MRPTGGIAEMKGDRHCEEDQENPDLCHPLSIPLMGEYEETL